MRKTGFLYAIAIFLISSCNYAKRDYSVVDFPLPVELQSQNITLMGILSDPKEIIILDSVYIVKDSKSEFILHIFSLDSHEYMGGFIRRGRGPSEEILIQSVSRAAHNSLFYKTLSGLTLAQFSPKTNSLESIMIYEVPVDALTVAYPLNETKVLGWNYTIHENEFLLYNPSDKQFSDFGNGFPYPGKNLTLEEKHRLFSNKQMTIKPDKQKFATAYMSFPMIRVFNSIDGKLITEFNSPQTHNFPYAMINRNATQDEIKELVENYFTITSTDQYIYALYSGKTKNKLYPDLFTPNFSPPDFGNEIHVWDWEGNPVKKISLDQMIFSFDVCLKDSTILAISVNDPDKIMVFGI